MLLGRNEEKPSVNVMVDNKPTESSKGMKLLGVTLDDNLITKCTYVASAKSRVVNRSR